MMVRKHPVEQYKHYTIYVVSGIKPELWLAEKENPAKGPTLTANNLEELKTSIDKALDYMVSIKINIYEGPEINKVFQKNSSVKINANGLTYESIVIVVTGNIFAPDYIKESDTDEEKERKEEEIELSIEIIRNQPIRVSKKYRKTNKHLNLAKFFNHNSTVHQR